MKHRIFTAAAALAVTAIAQAFTSVDLKLKDSAIFPYTEHSVTVTIPDGYESGEKAAVYVGLDGILCNAPAVIDSLVAEGAIPPMVGIFLQPGVVRGADGTIVRYNRSNEFDSTNGDFARFLETEVLPAVDSLMLEDGRILSLTDDPNERMIFGLSSGGIAAFAAAWNRPDLFRRVFCGCGTFVPMRGGEELQVLVRKTEPKPIRIFLEDGYDDAWNPLFGSWYEANTVLASALKFAGYDCDFYWHEGVHSVSGANRVFKDVMKWMWRDYPQLLEAGGTHNNMLRPLLEGASDWEKSGTLAKSGDSCALYPDGSLAARAIPGSNWLSQSLIGEDGSEYAEQRFYWLHSPDNRQLLIGGMAFDGNGNLWVLTDAGLQICDQNGRVRGILVLPPDVNATESGIRIEEGMVYIDGYKRRLSVPAPIPGVKPKSQGQA